MPCEPLIGPIAPHPRTTIKEVSSCYAIEDQTLIAQWLFNEALVSSYDSSNISVKLMLLAQRCALNAPKTLWLILGAVFQAILRIHKHNEPGPDIRQWWKYFFKTEVWWRPQVRQGAMENSTSRHDYWLITQGVTQKDPSRDPTCLGIIRGPGWLLVNEPFTKIACFFRITATVVLIRKPSRTVCVISTCFQWPVMSLWLSDCRLP